MQSSDFLFACGLDNNRSSSAIASYIGCFVKTPVGSGPRQCNAHDGRTDGRTDGRDKRGFDRRIRNRCPGGGGGLNDDRKVP